MIQFKQKEFTEYDALVKIYRLVNNFEYRGPKVQVINKSEMIPILKGNNVVIEKFVIATKTFGMGKNKFRMTLRVGTKATFPDNIRLADWRTDMSTIGFGINIKNGDGGGKKNNQKNFSLFDSPKSRIWLNKFDTRPIGDVVFADRNTRTVVIEYERAEDAARSLSILPFGINYKLYLLNPNE